LRSQLPAAPAVKHGPAAVPAFGTFFRARSSNIPTFTIGVSISVTIMHINISISIGSTYFVAVDATLMSVVASSSTTAAHPRCAAAQWQVGVRETGLQQLFVKRASSSRAIMKLSAKQSQISSWSSAERTRPAVPGLPAGIVRAEVLRVHRACKSDRNLHVIIQVYDFSDALI
jgi:hypothetical protein